MKRSYDFELLGDRMDYAIDETKAALDPENKITKKQLYKDLNLSQTAFAQYRKGSEPSSGALRKTAAPLGFSIHWLVTGEGPRFISDESADVEQPTPSIIPVKHLYKETIWNIFPDSLIPVSQNRELRFCEVEYPHPSSFKIDELLLIDLSYKHESGIFMVKVGATRRIVFVQFSGESFDVLDLDDQSVSYPSDKVQLIGKVFWKSGPV